MELVSDFKAYLSSIEPPAEEVSAAKTAHLEVREIVRTDPESKEAHKETFLSGSYARSTAINDINDVDVICILDIDRYNTQAEVVLAWVEAILAKHYDNPKRQGRSIGVKAKNGVWLDIVPATPISADDGPLWIPDREAREWVQTHPRSQIAAATAKNKATNGFYVQVVKLLKAWRDRLPNESCRLKSYILEALIYATIGFPSSHAIAIVNVLEGIERSYGIYRNSGVVPVIPDPGYSSVNVAKRLSPEEFTDFMTQVKTAAATARKAFDDQNESSSRRLWRQLFGQNFG
ncbi:MAG: SMODS domain-containing nucleotidyltransferase [Candidatus Acidiferrales bacterium]